MTVAISLERYCAAHYPMDYRQVSQSYLCKTSLPNFSYFSYFYSATISATFKSATDSVTFNSGTQKFICFSNA